MSNIITFESGGVEHVTTKGVFDLMHPYYNSPADNAVFSDHAVMDALVKGEKEISADGHLTNVLTHPDNYNPSLSFGYGDTFGEYRRAMDGLDAEREFYKIAYKAFDDNRRYCKRNPK